MSGQAPDALIISRHDGELEQVSALQRTLETPLPLLWQWFSRRKHQWGAMRRSGRWGQ